MYISLSYLSSLQLGSGKPEENHDGKKSYIVEIKGEQLEDRDHFIVETQKGLGVTTGDIETRSGGGRIWIYVVSCWV